MPSRFYFHLNNGEDVIRDEEGILVSDADAALIAAMEVIQELRAQDAVSAAEWQGWTLEITDEAGRIIESLSRRSAPNKVAATLGIEPLN